MGSGVVHGGMVAGESGLWQGEVVTLVEGMKSGFPHPRGHGVTTTQFFPVEGDGSPHPRGQEGSHPHTFDKLRAGSNLPPSRGKGVWSMPPSRGKERGGRCWIPAFAGMVGIQRSASGGRGDGWRVGSCLRRNKKGVSAWCIGERGGPA